MPRAFLLKARSWDDRRATEMDGCETGIRREKTSDENYRSRTGNHEIAYGPRPAEHGHHVGRMINYSTFRINTNGELNNHPDMPTQEVLLPLPLKSLVRTKGLLQGGLFSPIGPSPIAKGMGVCHSTGDLIQYDIQTFSEGLQDVSRDQHGGQAPQRSDDADSDSCDEIDVMNDDEDDEDVDICDVSDDDEVFATSQDVQHQGNNLTKLPASRVPMVSYGQSSPGESLNDLSPYSEHRVLSSDLAHRGATREGSLRREIPEHPSTYHSRPDNLKTITVQSPPPRCPMPTQGPAAHLKPQGHGSEESSPAAAREDPLPSHEAPSRPHSNPDQGPPLTPSPPLEEGRWHSTRLYTSDQPAMFGLRPFGLPRYADEPCSRLSDDSLPGDRSPGASSSSTSSPEARIADRHATLRPFSCTPPDVSPPSLLYPTHMRSLSHPPAFWPGVLPGLTISGAPQNFLDLSFRRLQQLHYENSRREGPPCRIFPGALVRPALPIPLVQSRRPVVTPQVIHPLVPTQHAFTDHYESRLVLSNQVSNSFKASHEAYKSHVIKPVMKYPSDMDRRVPSQPEKDCEKKRRKDFDTPRFTCDGCGKSYSTFSGLSKHKQFHCTSHVKKQFSCKYCDKTYVSLGALKMHIRTHTLPCKCPLCGKAFSRPWLLQGHIRTHTGEKPFKCQHCARAFADRSNLRAHLQTHSDVKKYNCKSCAKTFSRMSLLLKHEDGGCSGSI